MSTLRRYLHTVQRVLRPPFYLKRQTFVTRYQVMIKNIADTMNEVIVVVPVPLISESQRVASDPRFTPAITETGTEERFGNRFAFWKAKLAPGESRLFTEHFTVSVEPIKKIIPPGIALSSYGSSSGPFCAPSAHVQADHEQIRSLAHEAAAGATDVKTLLTNINEFVMKRLEYGNPINGLYSALEAVQNVKVDCGGYDSLFVALCIANGVPARIVSGFWAGYATNDMHAWVQVQLPDGEWVSADPSTEALVRAGRSKKFSTLGSIGSDRIAFSVGCDISLTIFKKERVVDILQHPFVQSSVGGQSLTIETRVETTKA